MSSVSTYLAVLLVALLSSSITVGAHENHGRFPISCGIIQDDVYGSETLLKEAATDLLRQGGLKHFVPDMNAG